MSESLVPSLFVAVQKIDLYDTSQIFDLLIVLKCQYMHVYFHIMCYVTTPIAINRLKAVSGNNTLPVSSCANGCVITLDTGFPYIAGPSEEIMALQDFIGAKKDSSGDVRMG